MGVINSPGACLRLLRGILEKNGTPELPFVSCCGSEEMGLGTLLLGVTEVSPLVALLSLSSWRPKSAFGLALWLYFALFLGLIATPVYLYNCEWRNSHGGLPLLFVRLLVSVLHEFIFFLLFTMSSYIYLILLRLRMKFSLCWFTLMPALKLKSLGQDFFCL